MLLARIPWAHTNVLAKLDTLEMAANALVSILKFALGIHILP